MAPISRSRCRPLHEYPAGGRYPDVLLSSRCVCSQVSEGTGNRRTGCSRLAAKRAGLETGDRIVSVHGNAVKTWEELEIALGTAPKNALDVEVIRDNRALQLHFDPPADADPIEPAALGFKVSLSKTIVDTLDVNKPAQKAGLKEGDEILSVSGQRKDR